MQSWETIEGSLMSDSFTCWCGERGHISRQCTADRDQKPREENKKKERDLSKILCGKSGHLMASCTEKKYSSNVK